MSKDAGDRELVNILLVDDRPSNLTSLEAALRRPDYNIVLASSGADALAQVLRREFAVILLDVAMPGMDGFETAKIIKEREQSKLIPIIFITASVYDMEHVFRGYTVGAVDYLRKPADTHQVRAKVAVFVELFHQRKQIEHQSIRLREAELREQHMLRERVETALRQSEALYEHTFDDAPVGIGHAGPEGTWLRVNVRLCETLGLPKGAVVGASIADMVEGEDARKIVDALDRINSGAIAVYSEEHKLATATGSDVWGRIIISALREADRIVRLLVVVENVSDRRKAEGDRTRMIHYLEQSLRVRDDFLAIAAHELKTPITPLRLQTASLIREHERARNGAAQVKLLRRLKKIDTAASRVEGLVDRLLDFSRLSVGEVALDLDLVDLRAVAESVIVRLADDARRSGSTLSLEAPCAVTGNWDRIRLEQVISNLVLNAIKYGEGKPIEVALSGDETRARLSVQDRGVGVPLAHHERIFERFDRLSPVRHYGGFGIGLWVAREIVEAHGGHITVSSAPGQGSTFTVELPKRVAQSEAA